MIWAVTAGICSIGLFITGYFIGLDKGQKNEHVRIVNSQLKKTDWDRPNCKKTGTTCDERSRIKKSKRFKLKHDVNADNFPVGSND